MVKDTFLKRKKDILSKLDKSSKGNWDKRILRLCMKINSSSNYYTTSSCSGRVVLMLDEEKKQQGLFVEVYHDKISFENLKRDLKSASIKKGKIKFKMEPCILHVVCRNLEYAQTLFDRAKLVGWKKSGIISTERNVVLELNSTEKLEFPVIDQGEILVNDKFLKLVVNEANKKLEKSWEKIKKLGMMINNYSIENKHL